MSTLVTWLERHLHDRLFQNIPHFFAIPIRKLIVRLSRTPLLNSYVWTPPEVWKHGWAVTLGGPYFTQVPPLPTEFLQDMDVLQQFIFRFLNIETYLAVLYLKVNLQNFSRKTFSL